MWEALGGGSRRHLTVSQAGASHWLFKVDLEDEKMKQFWEVVFHGIGCFFRIPFFSMTHPGTLVRSFEKVPRGGASSASEHASGVSPFILFQLYI